MPLQNRVTPFGEIVAVPERGMFMGNRGCLHDDQRRLRRQFCSQKFWIICRTEFRGRKRTLMTPGRYTELFFLDEATALAAGHRPCGECRRGDYQRFKATWTAGNADAALGESPGIKAIDQRLHEERLREDGSKRTYREVCGNLPDGVFVTLPDAADAFLLWKGQLLRWTPGGYADRFPAEADSPVNVLTPRSTVRAIAAGIIPVVHPTAPSGRIAVP